MAWVAEVGATVAQAAHGLAEHVPAELPATVPVKGDGPRRHSRAVPAADRSQNTQGPP